LISLPENPELDLTTISRILSILLAITAPKRSSEIVRFDTRFMQFRNDGVIFQLPGLSKTQSDCTPKEVFYAKFNENQKLCIVRCLESYLHITSKFRSSDKTKPDPLLRTLVKPHRGLSANTVASWIKQVLQLAGIDINKFKTHSTRRASTSKAKNLGVSISEILNMADWSNASTFKRFYYKPSCSQSKQFGTIVLSMCKYVFIPGR